MAKMNRFNIQQDIATTLTMNHMMMLKSKPDDPDDSEALVPGYPDGLTPIYRTKAEQMFFSLCNALSSASCNCTDRGSLALTKNGCGKGCKAAAAWGITEKLWLWLCCHDESFTLSSRIHLL